MPTAATASKLRRPEPDQLLARQHLAFTALPRRRLAEIARALGIATARKPQAGHLVDAMIGAGRLGEALDHLTRDELRAMCRALGVDSNSAKKRQIAATLFATLAPKQGAPTRATASKPLRRVKTKANPASNGSGGGSAASATHDYRHDDTRKNNPPAGLLDIERPPPRNTKNYSYDPHLDPQLQWAGKVEHAGFEVDTVSLHIHERISTQAIVRAVRREDDLPSLNLFAKPNLPASQEVEFYAHDVGWSNRLVLGDSLLVMNSLLERETMAGQVQCIFIDPPYGVKFNSNFQPAISRRNVKDGDDASLTREPEQIQAYRDTWELGIHSYLTYLRDRLLLARTLLATTGSVFVQISDDNIHHVREIMDEVFGKSNFCALIVYQKTGGQRTNLLSRNSDFIVWYARDAANVKYRQLYAEKLDDEELLSDYSQVELEDGTRRGLTKEEKNGARLPAGARRYQATSLTSQNPGSRYKVDFAGKVYLPPGTQWWKTDAEGMQRLIHANRVVQSGSSIRFKRFLDDFPVAPLTATWADTGGGFSSDKVYVVQTNVKAVQRCILMTTDPGDIVLDPTCGSGTTAYVAEQWGRRWITCDTSRVALSIARQRLLTARFPFYELRTSKVRDGFRYKTVAHITLKSIARNTTLDRCTTKKEMNEAIASAAEQETLYDQPVEDKKRVRVAGPFTVEAITLASMEGPQRDIGGSASRSVSKPGHFSDDVQAYLDTMMNLLRQTGVVFPGNKRLRIPNLRSVRGNFKWFHAEGGTDTEGGHVDVAVSFGPKHGPITPTQVLGSITETRGKQLVLFVGFACDPEARKIIDRGVLGRELVFANATPDIIVGDLLKDRKMDQLFSVFGAPDVRIHQEDGSRISVELIGIDLYDPITGETHAVAGEKAAAVFVDHDYDGKSFCVSQALFPGGGPDAWEKIQKALKGSIDQDQFAQLRTTRSIAFKPGPKVAVKVIDDRGNEVIKLVDGLSNPKT